MKKVFVVLVLFALSPPLAAIGNYTSPAVKDPCVATLAECPLIGCGGDPKLNSAKNRTDKPGASDVEKWKLSQIIGLSSLSPASWSSGKDRTDLVDLGEGTAVEVKGWLINVHVTKTPETCNCYLKGQANNDFHLNLVPRKNDSMQDSVVIELSPRSRHTNWKLATLEALADTITYVRETGWLMFDSAHANFSHMPRAMAWEVHPVTKFEVCQSTKLKCDKGMGWKALEAL